MLQPTMRLCLATIALAGPASTICTAQPLTAAAVEEQIESVVGRMTLEEKLGQLTQYRGRWSNTGPKVPEGGEAEIRAGKVGSFLGVYGAEYTRAMQRVAVEESRLGIPLLFAEDVIHGFRTIFPVPLAEASSWDTAAVKHAARLAAREATAHGIHWTFAPVADIARDPRWGRIVEGAGEDPYLCSALAAARVDGFQGEDLSADDTLAACAKHFAAYGGAEGGRDYNTVDISERTLREVYLPPFKAAVEAGVETLMASFNEVSGIPAHSNSMLLRDILRREWGFDGFVVSDFTGILELMQHGVAATRADAGMLALGAGIDMDMMSAIYIDDLPAAVRGGRFDEALVDNAVRRVLRTKHKLGLFEDPYRYCNPDREQKVTHTDENRRAARELAGKCQVLLKNEGDFLPLDTETETIAVIGPLADHPRAMLGGWAAKGRADEAVTILQGIRDAVAPEVRVLHAAGCEITAGDRSGFPEAERVAHEADVVVLVVGEHHDMSSEAHNRTELDLPGLQDELARAIHATGKPMVTVLVAGRPLSVGWLDDHVPAILEAWFLGNEMGHAVADVLFGTVNPSGKLPVTFPRTVGQVPVYYNHKNTGRPPDPNNKYTSKYIDVPWTPLYPFGHGLSYTTFRYDSLHLSAGEIRSQEKLVATVDVTNTGKRPGVEIVQLYLRDEVASVTPYVQKLRGFRRVELTPGETKTLSFTIGPADLAMYNQQMELVIEPGVFTVMVGGSSTDVIEERFELVE